MLPLTTILVCVALAILVLLVFAWFRNAVVIAIYQGAGLVASSLVVIALGLRADLAALRVALTRAWTDLAYSSEHTPAHLVGRTSLWDIVSPLAMLICLIVFLAADIYFSDLRFAALLGTRPHVIESGLPAGTLAAALFVCLSLIYGLVLFDLRLATPGHRPWVNFSPHDQRRLTWVCATGLLLTILAAMAAWCWGALQAYDEVPVVLDVGLPLLLWTVLAVLLVGGTLLAGFAVVVGLGALWMAVLAAVLVIGSALALLVDVLISLLGAAAKVLTGFYDIVASTGITIHNWIAGFGWARRLRFTPIVPVTPDGIEITVAEPIIGGGSTAPEEAEPAVTHTPDRVAANRRNGRWPVVERVES